MKIQFVIILILINNVFGNINMTDYSSDKNSKILSRKKRYLVFPEGSSFQLVYCFTMPTYGMGQIFTIGLTAALAWELPHSPMDFKSEKSGNSADKRVDKPLKITTNPVYQSSIIKYGNPWVAHYKMDSDNSWITPIQQSHFIPNVSSHKMMTRKPSNYAHKWELLPAYKSHYLYRKHGEIHRRTRRELFTKIEKFFIAQNKDGKACLLKAVCEVNQTNGTDRGTFIEEILRAIFTWIPEDENSNDEEEYNGAASHKGNCTEKYPSCSQSVWNPFF